jgi:hypothetical protein
MASSDGGSDVIKYEISSGKCTSLISSKPMVLEIFENSFADNIDGPSNLHCFVATKDEIYVIGKVQYFI